ncbi:MAG: hypothetical protein H7Y30_00130 [Pyrinomonadaceae bacterium]|nr:hypothetical protein [Pyrinomonadaceae bacterium]
MKRPSVEGPDFVKLVREVEKKVKRLEDNKWDFKAVPEAFAAPDQAADVIAKELVHIHDGQMITRVGRLIMGGVGSHFNLMGPIRSDARLKVTNSHLLDAVNLQLGSDGLLDLPEYRRLETKPQAVDFYNYGLFYTPRDLVFWLLLHDSGCFPSTLEHMMRKFAEGYVVQNDMYAPARPSKDLKAPALMAGACLMMQFPSKVIEWMDKPLFGGLAPETIHVETLLTIKPSRISHPHLPLVAESKVEIGYQNYYLRRFAGVSPKDGLRGPNVSAESAGD